MKTQVENIASGMNSLLRVGDNILDIPMPTPGCFNGLAFVFTGEFKSCSRTKAKSLVKSCEGFVRSAVSSKTNFLVIGKAFGREFTQGNKYNKASRIVSGANKSDLKLIGQNNFFALVGSQGGKRAGKGDSCLHLRNFLPDGWRHKTSFGCKI